MVAANDAQGQPQQAKPKRFSFSRLVPPSTSPLNPARVPSAAPSNTSSTGQAHAHGAHAPTPPAIPGLPALPALPGSRRWFSGTMSASAENLHSFPYHSSHGLAQSSESLASHTHTLPGSSNLAGGAVVGNGMNGPGSGASTTAGSLYESSPFAPSESERKKLMGLGGMWGQMGMGGLGKRFSTGAAHAHASAQGVHGQEEGLGRSTSLDLAPHDRGQSAPTQHRSFGPSASNLGSANGPGSAAAALAGTSPQSQQSWMARHLHLQSSGLGNGSFGSSHAHSASIDSSASASESRGVPIGGATNSSSTSGGMRSFFGSSPSSASTKLGASPNAPAGAAGGFGALGSSPSHRFSDALQAIAGDSPAQDESGAEGDKKEKGFNKLFSFRKPSAAKLGSSPGAQSTGSAASAMSDKA